jgi:Cyclic nucleotide-binding domain
VQPELRGWPVARVEEREPREVKEHLSRRQEVLAQMPIFSDLPKKHLRQLARVSGVREYPEGTFIVRQGEHGSMFYAVLCGQARVVRSRRIVAEVAPVGFFGEISLLDGGPRAASVVATTDVRDRGERLRRGPGGGCRARGLGPPRHGPLAPGRGRSRPPGRHRRTRPPDQAVAGIRLIARSHVWS